MTSDGPDDRSTAPATEGNGERPSLEPTTRRRFATARRWLFELTVLLGVYLAASAWQERNLIPAAEPAPSFSLRTTDGREVSLDSLSGKRVLLHFWATWCGVCRREFSALNAVQKGLAHDEVLLGIVADSEDPDRVRRFIAEEHIEYPVLLADERVLRAFRVGSFPTNYFLDGTGRIASRTVGMSSRFSMRARLALAR